MPNYKRRKVNRAFRAKPTAQNHSEDIVMSSSKPKRNREEINSGIKVIRGTKLKRKHRLNIILSTVAVLVSLFIILSAVLPVSLYENFVNITSLFGTGSYPKDITGSTVLNTVSNGSFFYVLSDTSVSAYSNSGKTVFSESHGFSNPILSVSQTRALVYDQGGNTLLVYNLGGLIDTVETKQPIITASISRSGTFAVATQSDEYTSSVYLYNKKFEQVYEWNSAKNIINNVRVNPSGKKIAVSTLNSVGGEYESKVLVLTFDSADPVFTLDVGNSIVYSLDNTGGGFSVITADKYRYVHWSKYTTSEIASAGEINMFRQGSNGTLLVFNRANDRSDNTVVLVSKRGKKVAELSINYNISDIQYSRGRIYFISDTMVNIIDKKGNLLRGGSCEYGCVKFAVIGSNTLAVVTDREIQKTDIKDKG